MAADGVAAQMRSAAASLLGALAEPERLLAARPFSDDSARRWLEYRPEPRPGACVAEMSGPARKAASRLLATGLSEHAYAQAMAPSSRWRKCWTGGKAGSAGGTAATTG
jgi:hypothetical protein